MSLMISSHSCDYTVLIYACRKTHRQYEKIQNIVILVYFICIKTTFSFKKIDIVTALIWVHHADVAVDDESMRRFVNHLHTLSIL
jgi:hypothetical protein